MQHFIKPLTIPGLLSLACSNIAGYAQQPVLETVTVTAQKIEQSSQDIPIAVNVLNKKRLSAQRVFGLADLASGTTPSLHASQLLRRCQMTTTSTTPQ